MAFGLILLGPLTLAKADAWAAAVLVLDEFDAGLACLNRLTKPLTHWLALRSAAAAMVRWMAKLPVDHRSRLVPIMPRKYADFASSYAKNNLDYRIALCTRPSSSIMPASLVPFGKASFHELACVYQSHPIHVPSSRQIFLIVCFGQVHLLVKVCIICFAGHLKFVRARISQCPRIGVRDRLCLVPRLVPDRPNKRRPHKLGNTVKDH